MKLLAKRLIARDVDRSDDELQVGIALLAEYAAVEIPVAKTMGLIGPGYGTLGD